MSLPLLLLCLCLSLPVSPAPGVPWQEGGLYTQGTPPPGPPEILPEVSDDYGDPEEEDNLLAEFPSLEITAVVSRSPNQDLEDEDGVWADDWEDGNSTAVLVSMVEDAGPLLVLSWWQILLLLLACVLVSCLCGYLTGCCFLTVDCCSDPYWGCCSCLRPCVLPLKPPPNVSHSSLTRKETHLSTSYSLNESATAPRRSVERSTRSLTNERGSSRSVRASSPPKAEMEDIPSTPLAASTLQSTKSVRNYKRSRAKPSGRQDGLSESLPHVYQEHRGSYFSWLHLLGRSSKRYNVSAGRKYRSSLQTNNNTVYRQNTRYKHIADNSRNSAVIPTKIAKRSSTASTMGVRPWVDKRSRSAETLDSLEEPLPLLETSRSERHIPRSRLSANLVHLESVRNTSGPLQTVRAEHPSGLPHRSPAPRVQPPHLREVAPQVQRNHTVTVSQS